ncbi:hypothetical protein FRC03_000809 [Tulasnella sp. 419]|nr:hypothetical protein FRC03_000809 [Tulasnella sp. 419]
MPKQPARRKPALSIRVNVSDEPYRSSPLRPSPLSSPSWDIESSIKSRRASSKSTSFHSVAESPSLTSASKRPITPEIDSVVSSSPHEYGDTISISTYLSAPSPSTVASGSQSIAISPQVSLWQDSNVTELDLFSEPAEGRDATVSWDSGSLTPRRSVRSSPKTPTSPALSRKSSSSSRTISTRRSGHPSIRSQLSTVVSSIKSEPSTSTASRGEAIAEELSSLVNQIETIDHGLADRNLALARRVARMEQEVLDLSYFLRRDVEERREHDIWQANMLEHLQQIVALPRSVTSPTSSTTSYSSTETSSTDISFSIPEPAPQLDLAVPSPVIISPEAPSYTVPDFPELSISSLDNTPIASIHDLHPHVKTLPPTPSSLTTVETPSYSPPASPSPILLPIRVESRQAEVKKVEVTEETQASLISPFSYLDPTPVSTSSSSTSTHSIDIPPPAPSINPVDLMNRLKHLEEQHLDLIHGQRRLQSLLNDLHRRPFLSVHDPPSDQGLDRSLRHIEERLEQITIAQTSRTPSRQEHTISRKTLSERTILPSGSLKNDREKTRTRIGSRGKAGRASDYTRSVKFDVSSIREVKSLP